MTQVSQLPSKPHAGHETVLVIDDDEEFRDLAVCLLQSAGYTATIVSNVDDGIRRLRSSHYDLLILDIVMPDRDGLESLPELRRLFPETRIITISGAGDSDIYLKVSELLGADACLAKSEVGALPRLVGRVLRGGFRLRPMRLLSS